MEINKCMYVEGMQVSSKTAEQSKSAYATRLQNAVDELKGGVSGFWISDDTKNLQSKKIIFENWASIRRYYDEDSTTGLV